MDLKAEVLENSKGRCRVCALYGNHSQSHPGPVMGLIIIRTYVFTNCQKKLSTEEEKVSRPTLYANGVVFNYVW